MKIELVMSATSAARLWVEKYRCHRHVRSWMISPMTSLGVDLRAINDCVQNQTISAPTTIPVRSPIEGQCITAKVFIMLQGRYV